jgi:hypothetical protein
MRTQEQKERGEKLIAALEFLDETAGYDEGTDEFEAVQVPGDGLFQWDFRTVLESRSCGTAGCAMGLGKELGLWPDTRNVREISRNLGADYDALYDVFFGYNYVGEWGPCNRNITPGMVATELRRVFADADKE